MNMRALRCYFTGLALFLAASFSAAHAQTDTKRFVQADGLFSLMLPADVEIRTGEEAVAAKIVSRHGWVLTVQTGKSNRDIDFRGMISKLEDRYLGDNLAWSKKISERTAIIGGLPALEAIYEATRSRVQAIIARGQITDFVIFVLASPDVFKDRAEEIYGILSTFATRPNEIPVRAQSSLTATDEVVVAPADAREERLVSQSLANQFSDPALGFSINYPADWTVSRDDTFSALFSGGVGTDAYYATIATQNISPPGASGPAAAAEAAFNSHRDQLEANSEDLKYASMRSYTYNRGGIRLLGQSFQASYSWNGERFLAWVVVLPNPIQPVAHIFSYTATADRFSMYRPIAEAMLRSWAIRGTESTGKNP